MIDYVDPRQEAANQRELLRQQFLTRAISSVVAYSLMTVYLPFWPCLLLYFADLLFETLGLRLLKDIDPERHRGRLFAFYLTLVACELFYCVPSMLIWQIDEDMAKALAVGLVCMTTFQVSSARSIYLPFGIVTMATTATVAVTGNYIYWSGLGDLHGLAVTTFGIAAAAFYSVSSMLTNHRMHRSNLRNGAEAKAASLAKGRFIAQISHELRTPLNAIIGMGASERAQASSAASIERMNVLIASAQGLAVILDDILDISALDGRGVTIRREAVHLTNLLETTVLLFRPQFDAAGLSLDLRGASDLPTWLSLDPARLRQCLSNLLSNALKFTDDGAVQVFVSMDGSLLQIDVQDSGRGISAAERRQLFQPFQRGPSDKHGTGLGLAISRGLARQMGGDLVLLPCENGAHFRLTLETEAAEPAPEPEKPLRLDGLRVLVVDDITTNRLVACTYLRQLGAATSEANSGSQAIAMVSECLPDLILMDMHMPHMSGIECLAKLREFCPHPVPVIAMTAHASLTQRDDYLASGLDGYLAKPLTMETVQAALRPHLPKQPQ